MEEYPWYENFWLLKFFIVTPLKWINSEGEEETQENQLVISKYTMYTVGLHMPISVEFAHVT